MSSIDQDLKRMASPEPEEAEPNKRRKQNDENDACSEASQIEESSSEAVAAAHSEDIQAEGEVLERGESQQNNDLSNEIPQLGGSGTGESAGAGTEESQADPATGPSTGNEANESKEARDKTKKAQKEWMKTVNKFVTHGNDSGFFCKDLRDKGHTSRPPMLPDERSRLVEDLTRQTNTTEPQTQQPSVGLDFLNGFTTAVDSPKDAAAFLNIDLQSLKISSKSALRLRIDQVQNVSFMVKKAEGVLKGCVNGNDYGTGKTVEALASVFFLAQRRGSCSNFDGHKATVILCPHQALRGWQETHAKYFAGLLALRLGSEFIPAGQAQPRDRASVFDRFLKGLSRIDPQTSHTVILFTYSDLSSKEFLDQREKKDARRKELSVQNSKLTEESLEALQVAQKPEIFDLKFNPEMIGTLIADEAEEIKHPKSRKAQAAYLLDADIHFLLTANPVDNKVSDFRGLLFALYKGKEWQLDWPSGVEHGDLLDMFDDDFDPFMVKGSKDLIPLNASSEYIQALREGQHLWRLSPHLYRWLGHKMHFGPEFAWKVLGGIYRLCLLRRGIVSVSTMPSSDSNTISGILALPPLSVRTIEVSMGHEEQHYKNLADMSFNWIFRDDEKDSAATAARVSNENQIPLAAFDNFWDAFLGHVTADLGLADVLRSEHLSDAPASRYNLPDIEALQQSNADSGMSFYYSMTRQVTDPIQPPSDRRSMIRHLVRRSPKLRWLLVKLEELKQRGEKVVIYCVHPLTQWLVEGVCSMAEFNFLSLRSKPKHDDEARAAVLGAFNDPSQRYDFLLGTFRILGHGVDLHADCHNLIIFELPDSIPTMMSAIGRIRRLGQTSPQAVSILTMKDSYDDFTLQRQSRKHATSILAFGVLGAQLDRLSSLVDRRIESHMLNLRREMSNSDEKDFLRRLKQLIPIREVMKLLATGELLRRQLGAQNNTSYMPWYRHQRFLFRPKEFQKMELANFSGAAMAHNTETGGLILRLIDQLPANRTPPAIVEILSERFKDQDTGSDLLPEEHTS